MDDIRRPRPAPRGYYSAGSRVSHRLSHRARSATADGQPQPLSAQRQHVPVHHPAASAHVPVGVHPRPRPASHTQQSIYHRPPIEQPTPAPQRRPKANRKLGGRLLAAGACLGVAGLLFGAGYSLKSSDSSKSLPAAVTAQADYTVYFPSPMPPGYSYMKDTATFQIGQVFYKFNNGSKRVTVKEEPLPNPAPDLSLLAGYRRFTASVGKAALGATFGQPTAVVVTPSTVITLNGTGGVTDDDLIAAINNLKNIGQSSERKT